jgi:hypothetical protein
MSSSRSSLVLRPSSRPMTWNSSKAALRFFGPFGQELGAGHLAHLVADDEHGHRDVLIGQLAEHRQSRGGRRGADHPEILAEPPAEIVAQGPRDPEIVAPAPRDPGVIVDREQDRM